MLIEGLKRVGWASIVVSAIIFTINIALSKDLENYVTFFETSQLSTWEELSAFSTEQSIEYFYLLLNKIWPGEFFTFVAAVVYLAISFKLIFFKWISTLFEVNLWYFVLAYIAFIGLVNDAAQLRIAIASGFFMLAIVYYMGGNFVIYSVLLALAVLLHGSMVALVFAFHFYKYFKIFFNPWFFLLFLVFGKSYILDFSNGIVDSVLEGSRYAHYFNVEADQQNSTGLFLYFYYALMLLTFLHSNITHLNNKRLPALAEPIAVQHFSDFCRNSGFMALYMMSLFSQSVPMAVRFAEMFLIFFMIDIIQSAKKISTSALEFNIVFAVSVASIGILRFYHTHIYLNPIFD